MTDDAIIDLLLKVAATGWVLAGLLFMFWRDEKDMSAFWHRQSEQYREMWLKKCRRKKRSDPADWWKRGSNAE